MKVIRLTILIAFSLVFALTSSRSFALQDNTPTLLQTKEWISLHLKESEMLSYYDKSNPKLVTYVFSRLLSASDFPDGEAQRYVESDCELYLMHNAITLFDGKKITEDNFPKQYNRLRKQKLDYLHFSYVKLYFPNDYIFEIGHEELEGSIVDGVYLSIRSKTNGVHWYRRKNVGDTGLSFTSVDYDSFSFKNIEDAERLLSSFNHINNLCAKRNDSIRERF